MDVAFATDRQRISEQLGEASTAGPYSAWPGVIVERLSPRNANAA
jgi:hypothetical protein